MVYLIWVIDILVKFPWGLIQYKAALVRIYEFQLFREADVTTTFFQHWDFLYP